MSGTRPEPAGNPVAHALHLVRETVPPMHPAGRPFVLGGIAATLLLRRFSKRLGVAGALATAATAAFFREPKRVPPPRTGVALASADGLVSLEGRVTVISTATNSILKTVDLFDLPWTPCA